MYAEGVRVLAHTRAGDGPRALVLLHGFLGSARNLGTLARGLAQRTGRAVVSLDLPGHGESPPLPPQADLAAFARGPDDDVGELLGRGEAAGGADGVGELLAAGRRLAADLRR